MKSVLIAMVVLRLLFFCGFAHADGQDSRQKISMPVMMKERMLARMRDHLLALQEIQAAMAGNNLDKASDIAEMRLGMSSMPMSMRHEMAPFMPQTMRMIGMKMHKAASIFAMKASEGDEQRALSSLSEVTRQCVACHAAYRLN
ncbi:MAG: hypothetical protein ACYC3O_01020 [Burkholderiales bacterium]